MIMGFLQAMLSSAQVFDFEYVQNRIHKASCA